MPGDPGEKIDAQIPQPENVVDIKAPRSRRTRNENDANARPPTASEWQEWFSKVLIRAGTNWWLSHAFEGIDENLLSDREVARLNLSDQECDSIAKPFAELANKLKITRKYGRTLIATTSSFDSLITLGQWFSRVNRIARKYRRQQDATVQGEVISEHSRPNPPPASGSNGNGEARGYSLYNPGTG